MKIHNTDKPKWLSEALAESSVPRAFREQCRRAQPIRFRQIGLLQVDIHRHSELSEAVPPGLLMEAKMKLAKDLEHHLRSIRLAPFAWAGDGGVFWIECEKVGDFDAIILAGELVFRVLPSVNALYASRFPEGRSLSLRVSAHYGAILTTPDTRFWHGRDLNFFMKNERRLSEPGMFSITRQLRDMLSMEQRTKFPECRSIVKEMDSERTPIYFHNDYGDLAGARTETASTVPKSPASVGDYRA